jgi:sodium/potassium/calcium exchanger 6
MLDTRCRAVASHQIIEGWREKGRLERAVAVLEFPWLVLRNLTIPMVEDDSWSKAQASVQPVCTPLFLLWVTGYLPDYGWRALFYGGCVGFLVYLSTHAGRPPRSAAALGFFMSLAFCACIGWIFLLADELVALLQVRAAGRRRASGGCARQSAGERV